VAKSFRKVLDEQIRLTVEQTVIRIYGGFVLILAGNISKSLPSLSSLLQPTVYEGWELTAFDLLIHADRPSSTCLP